MLGILFKGLITLSNQATGTALHAVLYAFAVIAHAHLMNSTVPFNSLLHKQTQDNCLVLHLGCLFKKDFHLSLID